jgi:hypothetical protein
MDWFRNPIFSTSRERLLMFSMRLTVHSSCLLALLQGRKARVNNSRHTRRIISPAFFFSIRQQY